MTPIDQREVKLRGGVDSSESQGNMEIFLNVDDVDAAFKVMELPMALHIHSALCRCQFFYTSFKFQQLIIFWISTVEVHDEVQDGLQGRYFISSISISKKKVRSFITYAESNIVSNIVVMKILLQRAKEAGGTIIADPEDKPWGQSSGFLRDIDGNVVRVGSHVKRS